MPRFVYACPRRWSDQDTYGHINNVQIMRYLEEARVGLFFDSARRAGVDGFEGALVVVRHEIDFRRPLAYRPEPVTIDCRVLEVRSSSFRLGYAILDDGVVCAEAVSVLAAVDPTSGRARRLTPAERAWLETYRDPIDDGAARTPASLES